MVCVETTDAAEDIIALAAGAAPIMTAQYRVPLARDGSAALPHTDYCDGLPGCVVVT